MEKMGQLASTSTNRHDDQDDDSIEEPPTKQKKLEKGSQQPVLKHCAKCELPASKVNIDNLPDELIVKILSHSTFQELIKVTQNVCKRWRSLSHDSQLWCDKELHIAGPHSDAEMKKALLGMPQLRALVLLRDVKPPLVRDFCGSCQYLTTLQIAPTQQMSCYLLKKLVEKCQNIRSLTIPGKLINDKHKAQALSQLQHLHSLDITDSYQENIFIYLGPLAEGCPDLEKLKVSEWANVPVEEFEYFINIKCKMLTHIALPYSLDKKRSVVPLLSQCTALIYLELYHCFVSQYEPQGLTALRDLTKLSSLIMNNIITIPPAPVPFKASGLSHLLVLDLSYGSGLEDSHVLAVCNSCRELKELYLTSCVQITDAGLVELYHLSELEILDLAACQSLRGAALQYVAELPKLRKLVLNTCDLRELLPGLNCVLDTLPLEELSLISCQNSYYCFASNRSSETVRSVGISHLRVLDLTGNRGMRDSDVVDVCRSCPGLRALCLQSCSWLIDTALVELYRLNELEMLDLSKCTSLGGTAIQHVAQLPNLRKLLLESCDLSKLLPGLNCILDVSSLEILSLLNGENLNNFPFDKISAKLVRLRVLHISADENEIKNLKKQMPGLNVNKNDCHHKYSESGRIMIWATRESYGDDAIGYVQLRRESGHCTLKCRICPEHKVRSSSYNVTMVVDEDEGEIVSCRCMDCAAAAGGCKPIAEVRNLPVLRSNVTGRSQHSPEFGQQ